MEAIILAGGYGTRLRQVISGIPKPMAPINGKPLLEYILGHLQKQGIRKVILSTGYKHEIIEQYFENQFNDIKIVYSVESEPLGTGGAIKKALDYVTSDHIFILNGDTFFQVNFNELYQTHLQINSDLTIVLKNMENPDRFGIIETLNNKVISFKEKTYKSEGTVNGGVYVIKSRLLQKIEIPEKFSFEKDFMENYFSTFNFNTFKSDAYFIDIGIPEDYLLAQKELPKQLW